MLLSLPTSISLYHLYYPFLTSFLFVPIPPFFSTCFRFYCPFLFPSSDKFSPSLFSPFIYPHPFFLTLFSLPFLLPFFRRPKCGWFIFQRRRFLLSSKHYFHYPEIVWFVYCVFMHGCLSHIPECQQNR